MGREALYITEVKKDMDPNENAKENANENANFLRVSPMYGVDNPDAQ